jgi:hypothetical protein
MRRLIKFLFGTQAGRRSARLASILAALVLAPSALNAVAQDAHAGSQQHLNPDARDAQGLTPLLVAVSAGQADTVRALLDQGSGINAVSADGRTALIAAAQNNRKEIVQLLVGAGANLNSATRATGTALEVAERNGETEIAALLLAAGARSSGESVGDTVCVLPWGGDGFCGTVKSFSIRSVVIQVTSIAGCANGCSAKQECSAARPVGGREGIQPGSQVAVPSWCLTQTGVKP